MKSLSIKYTNGLLGHEQSITVLAITMTVL